MKLIPSSPLVFVLVLVALFAAGMIFSKLVFNKKTAEKYSDDAYYGLPSTVKEFADSPKKLPPVPENRGVTTHDDYCQAFNC
jgi:hypothetical protein